MARFLQRPDLEAADLAGAVADLGYAPLNALAPAIDARISPALDTQLPQKLPGILPGAFDQIPFRKGREVNLNELGCVVGQDISTKLNAAIQDAPTGTVFLVPPVLGDTIQNSWVLDSPIVYKAGIGIRGVGWERRRKSVFWRSGAFNMIQIFGTGGGQLSNNMIGDLFLEGVSLWGGDFQADIWEMKYAAGYFNNIFMGGAPESKGLFISGQTQDSVWERIRWETCGSTDGTKGCLEIYDGDNPGESTTSGHTQNLVFRQCVWETYSGTAIKAYGKKSGLPVGASLLEFSGIKLEAPTRSYMPDINFDQVYNSVVNIRQIVSKGPLNQTKSAMIKSTNGQRNKFIGLVAHNSGGSTLVNVADITGSTDTTLDLTLAGNETVNILSGPEVIKNGTATTSGNNVYLNNVGSSSKKRPTSTQLNETIRMTQLYRTNDAVFQQWARVDAVDALSNGIRAIGIAKADGSFNFWGANARNALAGGPAFTLDTTNLWELSNDTGELWVTAGVRGGSRTTGPKFALAGTGSPEGVVAAQPGSEYTDVAQAATAGQRKWIKATGTGNTGWTLTAL